MSEQNNVVKFRKVPKFSIGLVIIVIIFVYVLFHMFTYFTQTNVTIAIVKQGNIVWDDHYNALAIRDEAVYFTSEEGYIYYQSRNKSKVGVKTLIYSLDQNGDIAKRLKKEEDAVKNLNDDEKVAIVSEISAFVNDYDSINFRRTYNFASNLSDTLEMAYTNEATKSLAKEIKKAEKNQTFRKYYAPAAGLVVLSVDGKEDLSLSNFSKKDFDSSQLKFESLRNNEKILSGQVVYKLITSDNWKLVMPIDNRIARRLADEKSIQVRFSDDNATTWTNIDIIEREKQKYLVLSLDDSMDRFADQRFVGIDLILEEENGLKVPNSSIAEKRYDLIPSDYLTKGGDSDRNGFMVAKGANDPKFVATGYFKEDENGMLWVSHDYFDDGDVIVGKDGSRFSINDKGDKLFGVYNVNKGYAQFKPVEVLYNNDEYSIIKPINNSDVNLYDHIALKAENIVEDDVVF